jgi:uncharacterized membrane protein
MEQALMILLRLVHILTGIFWAGGAFLMAGFVAPALRASGPAAGPVMQQLAGVRKLPLWLLWMSHVTLLSGVLLYARDSGGFRSAWMSTGTGVLFGLGGGLALAASVLGMTVNSPTAKRIGALAATLQKGGGPPSPEQAAEMKRLQERLGTASVAGSALLLASAAAMAVARFVP